MDWREDNNSAYLLDVIWWTDIAICVELAEIQGDVATSICYSQGHHL